MKFYCIILITLILTSCVSGASFLNSKDMAAEYYNLAEGYAGLKQYDKAIVYYKKASAIPLYLNASLYGIGRMHALKLEWKEAEKIFSKLYNEDPENKKITSAYVYTLTASGSISKAFDLFIPIVGKYSDDPEVARQYIGLLYIGQFYDALYLYAEASQTKFADSEYLKDVEGLLSKAKKEQDLANAPITEKDKSPVTEKDKSPVTEKDKN